MPTPILREAADLGRKAAADDLGDKCYNDEADTEQEDFRRQAADVGLQADGCKEDGRKNDIIADIHAALHIGGIVHGAQNDTGDIGTGDICNAEVFLGDVGHGKAERHAHDGDALGVGIALIQPCHSKVSHNAHAHGSGKEQHRINEHLAQTRAGAGACAQHTGEDYDADDIINDGGTDDGGRTPGCPRQRSRRTHCTAGCRPPAERLRPRRRSGWRWGRL